MTILSLNTTRFAVARVPSPTAQAVWAVQDGIGLIEAGLHDEAARCLVAMLALTRGNRLDAAGTMERLKRAVAPAA